MTSGDDRGDDEDDADEDDDGENAEGAGKPSITNRIRLTGDLFLFLG